MQLKDAIQFVCDWLEEDILDMESSPNTDIFDMNIAHADNLHRKAKKFVENEYWTTEVVDMMQECCDYIEQGLDRWDFDSPAERPDWYATALQVIETIKKSATDAQYYFD